MLFHLAIACPHLKNLSAFVDLGIKSIEIFLNVIRTFDGLNAF